MSRRLALLDSYSIFRAELMVGGVAGSAGACGVGVRGLDAGPRLGWGEVGKCNTLI